LLYLDIDDSFYSYSNAAANAPGAAAPADQSAALDASLSAGTGDHANRKRVSPDGTRMVQIFGERREAFLYDLTGVAGPSFLAYLAADVKRVRFSQAQPGEPFEILVVMNDGTFDVFDESGNSALQPAPPPDASAPPDVAPPPSAAPPLPAP
jgi:hypothetical protein